MFGNSTTAVVMRLDQNGDITIPKKMTVGQKAVITTLEVNQTSYLKNTEINGTLKINNVDTNTLYQTRAWVSLESILQRLESNTDNGLSRWSSDCHDIYGK